MIILFLGVSFTSSAAQSICVQARKLMNSIHAKHIQPRRLNDSFSTAVFTGFFRTLDPGQELFTSADTASLSVYKALLDKDGKNACDFVDKAVNIYRARALEYKEFVEVTLSHPLDYTKEEFIPAAVGHWTVAKTAEDLKGRILKELKFEILKSMYRQAAVNPKNLSQIDAFMEFENAARQRVRKNALITVSQMLSDEKKLRAFVEDSFLNAIPQAFDPHSAYFGKVGMREFQEAVSTSKLSFGIKLRVSQIDEVVVGDLVPGGPAWRSKKIKKGDVLVAVKWKTSGEYVDLIDVDINTVYQIIDGGTEDVATFSVRTPAGIVHEVELERASLKNEHNSVLSLVLTAKNTGPKIGYISLPGFFASTDGEYEGCADAVAKELIKLKGEGIEGLIFDLRYNTGGLLLEAIELAGLFIDYGPVAISESYRGRSVVKEVLSDTRRGTLYDGPLVVMVNGASASASEVVAAALQDYGRAIVVGTPTSGKATGQLVFPFQDEFVKVTDMRVYRLSGNPHQLTGVIPDFPIPDLSDLQYTREVDYDRALTPLQTTRRVTYRRLGSATGDVAEFSRKNVLSKDFETLQKMRTKMTGNIPLQVDSFVTFMKNIKKWEFELWTDPDKQNPLYRVSNCQYDNELLKGDLYHSEMNKTHQHEIAASIYIPEAYKLLDYVISKSR